MKSTSYQLDKSKVQGIKGANTGHKYGPERKFRG